MPQQESEPQKLQQAQSQQAPQQRLQDQQWMELADGEQAAMAALALAGPLQYPPHRLCPVFAQPEKPVMALAALAVVAVPFVLHPPKDHGGTHSQRVKG